MPSKTKKSHKIKHPKLKEKSTTEIKVTKSNIFEDSSNSSNHLNYKNISKKNVPVNNTYPVDILGHMNKHPEMNKYFQNNKYTYSVQMNKPVLTYNNFLTQKALNNMTYQEYQYYQQFQQQTYNFNGTFDVVNKKPSVIAIQSSLNYPMFSGGPSVGQTNGQIGYTPQPTSSPMNVNPNTLTVNGGIIQNYGNSPAYTGVLPKTLPGQNEIANMNAQQTKANNANINNPAYFNYGQYYY